MGGGWETHQILEGIKKRENNYTPRDVSHSKLTIRNNYCLERTTKYYRSRLRKLLWVGLTVVIGTELFFVCMREGGVDLLVWLLLTIFYSSGFYFYAFFYLVEFFLFSTPGVQAPEMKTPPPGGSQTTPITAWAFAFSCSGFKGKAGYLHQGKYYTFISIDPYRFWFACALVSKSKFTIFGQEP